MTRRAETIIGVIAIVAAVAVVIAGYAATNLDRPGVMSTAEETADGRP